MILSINKYPHTYLPKVKSFYATNSQLKTAESKRKNTSKIYNLKKNNSYINYKPLKNKLIKPNKNSISYSLKINKMTPSITMKNIPIKN